MHKPQQLCGSVRLDCRQAWIHAAQLGQRGGRIGARSRHGLVRSRVAAQLLPSPDQSCRQGTCLRPMRAAYVLQDQRLPVADSSAGEACMLTVAGQSYTRGGNLYSPGALPFHGHCPANKPHAHSVLQAQRLAALKHE